MKRMMGAAGKGAKASPAEIKKMQGNISSIAKKNPGFSNKVTGRVPVKDFDKVRGEISRLRKDPKGHWEYAKKEFKG